MQIEASDADGAIWQALAPSETVEADSAADAAAMAAYHQDIAEGDTWRVVAWDGTDTSGEPAATHYPES